METGLTKNQVISVLTRSPHGDLEQYWPVGMQAAAEDPAFFAHLVAWNGARGAIRDAKVALPVIALAAPAACEDAELRDNALAHIASLDPRNLVRAVRFAHGWAAPRKEGEPEKPRMRLPVPMRLIHRTVERYLRDREESPGRFERTAMQHRRSLQELYALLHIKPGAGAQKIIFEGSKLGVFADLAALPNMAPDEIAGTIMRRRIPFLRAMGALGAKAKDPAVVQALIGTMSPAELVTNTKMLERLGIKTNPALRAAYEAGLQRVATSKGALLKTTAAAAAVGGSVGEKLRGAQEKQLNAAGVEGDWLVLADKSGSMTAAIDMARHVAAVLARVALGRTHLVFFDTTVQYHEVTGKSLDEIAALTKRITAGGGTSIGVGLQYIMDKGIEVDGIAIVSDGAEHSPPRFAQVYQKYAAKIGKDVPVYLYAAKGEPNELTGLCAAAGLALMEFDVRSLVDYYSLPNLIATMRTNRFGLVDEILGTPLLRLEDVFAHPAPAPAAATV